MDLVTKRECLNEKTSLDKYNKRKYTDNATSLKQKRYLQETKVFLRT